MLTDSSALYGEILSASSDSIRENKTQQLKSRLFADGYLLLRKALEPESVQSFINQVKIPTKFEGTYHFGTQTMIGVKDEQSREPEKDELITVDDKKLNTGHLIPVMTQLQKVVQNILGEQSLLLSSEGWFRVKRGSSTIMHADYFFFEGDGFCQKLKNALEIKTDQECDMCGLNESGTIEKNRVIDMKGKPDPDYYCHTCSENYIPLYTCWLPLSDSDSSKGDSLLQCLESSQHMYGFSQDLFDRTEGQEQPRFYKYQVHDYEWKSPGHVSFGDLILFNCKTIHRAPQQIRIDQPRISLDVRAYDFSWPHDKQEKEQKHQTIHNQSQFCMNLVESIFRKTQQRHDQPDTIEFWCDQSTNMVFLWTVLAKLQTLRDPSLLGIHQEKLKSLSQLLFDTDDWGCVSPLHVVSKHWLDLPVEEKWWHHVTIKTVPVPTDTIDSQESWWDEKFDEWLITEDTSVRMKPYHQDFEGWCPALVFTWHRVQLQEIRSSGLNPRVLLLRHALLEWALRIIERYIKPMKLSYSSLQSGSQLTRECSEKIYFVTHLLFCMTDWGQSLHLLRVGECFSQPQLGMIYELLVTWFISIYEKWSTINLEVVYEMVTCIIMLMKALNITDSELSECISKVVDISLQTPRQILRLPKHYRSDPMISYHTALTLGFMLEVYLKYAKC